MVYEKTFGSQWAEPAIWNIKKAGTYTARIEVQPVGMTDTNPANNVATCTFTVTANEIKPPDDSGDGGIRGGLGSM